MKYQEKIYWEQGRVTGEKELLQEMKEIADRTENEGLRQVIEQIAKNRNIKI